MTAPREELARASAELTQIRRQTGELERMLKEVGWASVEPALAFDYGGVKRHRRALRRPSIPLG